MVVFPAPVGPTMAIVWPGLALTESAFRMGFSGV